jgi:hypothetical protein
MKARIEIDCTPEEARKFLGLPDLTELNAQLVESTRARLDEMAKNVAPEEMLKNWWAMGLGAQEQFRKIMTGGTKGSD